jgi:hypothetical protein
MEPENGKPFRECSMTFSIPQAAKRDDVQHMMMDAKQITTHPTFANLLRIDPLCGKR